MPKTQYITVADGIRRRRPSPEYGRFMRMRQRCLNPNDAAYPSYGGRGIKICQGWNSFEQFIADLGEQPSPLHSMDRIDNDGHYSCGKCPECVENGWPMNCRWATPLEQGGNKRNNVRITREGKTLTITEWAKELGIPPGTLMARRSRGTDVLAPVRPRRWFRRPSS